MDSDTITTETSKPLNKGTEALLYLQGEVNIDYEWEQEELSELRLEQQRRSLNP